MNKQWQQLISFLQKDRLPHALLFVSDSAQIVLSFAEDFIQLLLCEQNKTGQSCNACRSCLLIKADTHPNIIRIKTLEEKETIKIDQIRDCIEALQHTAVIGHRKVVLISLAEQMNVAASNALLKTLEEPIGDTFFILITQNIHALLPTIKSRCQKINFPATLKIEVPEEFYKKFNLFFNKELSLSDFVTWCLKQYNLKQNLNYLFQIFFDLAKKNYQHNLTNHNIFKSYDQLISIEKTLLENVHLNEQLVMENLLIEILNKN